MDGLGGAGAFDEHEDAARLLAGCREPHRLARPGRSGVEQRAEPAAPEIDPGGNLGKAREGAGGYFLHPELATGDGGGS